MICAGVDAGSRTIKVVLLTDEGGVLACAIRDQGADQQRLAQELLTSVLAEHGLELREIARTVATGYARSAVRAADTTITEITCHACGVHDQRPDAATVIEIGGQDSKVLHLNGFGGVRDFEMNDRCAAETGRFLEMVAARLGVDLAAFSGLAAQSARPAAITNTCAVFAETEIIGLLGTGTRPEDIAAGVLASIAARASSLAAGKADAPIIFTGGVALIPGMADALAAALERPVSVAEQPQLTGALGAALLARRQALAEAGR